MSKGEKDIDRLVRLGLINQSDRDNHIKNLQEVVEDLKDTVDQKTEENDQIIISLAQDSYFMEQIIKPFNLLFLPTK